jgi:hypothetical protein
VPDAQLQLTEEAVDRIHVTHFSSSVAIEQCQIRVGGAPGRTRTAKALRSANIKS